MARVGTEVHCFACTCRACGRALTWTRVMQRLSALVPNLPWTPGTLRMEKAQQIPSVDHIINTKSLLLQIRGFLLKHHAPRLVRKTPLPAQTSLWVVLYSDGYDPWVKSNYNVKVAMVDLAGELVVQLY